MLHMDDGLMFCSSCNIVIEPSLDVRGWHAPWLSVAQAESGAKSRQQTANAENGVKL